MIIPQSILLLALSASLALAEDAVKGICVDGDSEQAFAVSEVVPERALKGGYLPDVHYAEDGETPKAITWTASPKTRSVQTLIGRFKDREIVDIVFSEGDGTAAASPPPFEARMLAYRVGAAVTSRLVPFLVISGEQVRWYEQFFTSDGAHPFLLEVSRTVQGNGVLTTRFTFGFGDAGAMINEVNSSGRGTKSVVTKFRPDGTVESTRELDEN
jgi:hypothetical protein